MIKHMANIVTGCRILGSVLLFLIKGLLLFLWPLTWSFAEIKYSAVIICCIATFTSIQDGFHILKGES